MRSGMIDLATAAGESRRQFRDAYRNPGLRPTLNVTLRPKVYVRIFKPAVD